MAWYDTGTVNVTNGSTTVTGSGTNFVSGAQVGEAFTSSDGRLYEIQAVVSATSLTLADPYLGSTQTGQSYKIVPTQSLVANLATQVSTLISDFQTVADEAGEGKFDDGSAASPGITFTLDQDTGLYRPAANQIGFATAGVQRLLLTSTGLTSTVGFTGTTGTFLASSGNVLTVSNGSSGGAPSSTHGEFVVESDEANVGIQLLGTATSNQRILFGDPDSAGVGQITYDHTDNYMSFVTSNSERVRIDFSGNLGLKETNPSADLHISDGSVVNVRLEETAGSSYTLIQTDSAGTLLSADPSNSRASTALRFALDGSERMRIDSSGNVGIGTTSATQKLHVVGNAIISGSLSKGSGSFRIPHPIRGGHDLVHSFVEGPQADNIYRGKITLVNGTATVNLDEAARMTEGTFVALNTNTQCFTTNETDWTPVRGRIEGNVLTIEAQDEACTATVSWLVIGERHDQHMIDTDWTDENGRVITEPLTPVVEEVAEEQLT